MATRERLKRAEDARKAARNYAERKEDAVAFNIAEANSSCERALAARRALSSAFSAGVAYAGRRGRREAQKGGAK